MSMEQSWKNKTKNDRENVLYILPISTISEASDVEEDDVLPTTKTIPSLFKLSDSTGNMTFEKVAENDHFKTSLLDSNVGERERERE